MKIISKILLLFLCFTVRAYCNTPLYDDFAEEEFNLEEEIIKSEFNPRFGIFLNYGLNFHHTNFRQLPNYPICCEPFGNGFGTGLNFGASALFRVKNNLLFLDENWFYGAKLSFGNLNGKLENEQKEPITVAGNLTEATTKGVIDVSLNNLILSPFISYSVPQLRHKNHNFYVSLGLNIGATVNANFAQHEEIISPNVGTFENGFRVRNIQSGDLPNTNSFLLAGNFGISYELPLNKNNNLRLVPEITYSYWFSSPVKNLNWSISQLTFGVGVRYNEPPKSEPPPAEPILPDLPHLELPKSDFTLFADVHHKIFDADSPTKPIQSIVVEDFTQTNLKPLLNFIFFDDNSARIPARYFRIPADATSAFHYNQLQRLNSLETYYHILNIIGFRLTQFPSATIELVGTNTNKGLERNNIELSQARAENVKRYLTEVWKIEPRRIKTTARNLPKEPTKPTEESGDEENRRVEIYSSDSRIIEPIFSMDTVSVLRNKQIVFVPKVESSFGINNWKLEVSNSDTVLQTWSGSGDLPSEIIWETTVGETMNIDLVENLRSGILKYQLTVSDKVGTVQKSLTRNISIDRITVESKRVDNSADMEYEYYSLILFQFASRNLDAKHNSVIDFIRSRISPNSTVIISGYTDIIGNEEVNKRIATERARAAARRLGFANVEIRGIGKDELLYDNTFPEGRFYCRTVTIHIETPIAGK